MKKIFCNRVLPVMLAVVVMFSAIPVQAGAVGVGDESGLDPDSVAAWTNHISNPIADFVNVIAQRFGCSPTGQYVYWHIIDGIIGTLGVGEFTYNELLLLCNHLNSWFIGNTVSDLYSDVIDKSLVYASKTLSACMGLGTVRFEVVEPSPTAGFYRIQDSVSGLWLVNSDGQYPCAPVDGEVADASNRWLPEDLFKSPYTLVSIEELTNMATSVGADIAWNDMYYYIYRDDGCLVYADKNGLPYAAFRDPDAYASQISRPGTSAKDEEGDDVELPEDFDANIDLENMLITLPNGTLAILDSVIYDESTKSYYIDSHDTYNTTNNYYYHWEYHINYTSITYIGQTEEYNKYYEVYYELPDGRDSADLTKEEVEQLNISVDVIPYGRSADDTSLRSLYHFDGDTRDSSYWNYCTEFTWNEGASLTYMDAGVFNGALYLDETEHDFTLHLPSDIGSGDFTLQFRYYQSYTAAPQTDSYILFGDQTLLQLNGGYFVDPDDTTLHVTPTGTWNEVALIRSSGKLFYYLNGISIGSISSSYGFSNRITFHFGADQQTYKYFDELRVLDYALVESGGSYTPTSVPHDTNLALVLPDTTLPVADEYWAIYSSGKNLVNGDFSTGSLPDGFIEWGAELKGDSAADRSTLGIYSGAYITPHSNYCHFHRTDLNVYDGSMYPAGAIYVPISYWKNVRPFAGADQGAEFTLTVVLSDGSIHSVSAVVDEPMNEFLSVGDAVIGFDSADSGSYTNFYAYIELPAQGDFLDIVYVELIEGDSTDLSVEWVESVTPMTPDQLNTPTLAVRTDLDITSYQIGGVRPSVPEKGMVWALVENQRITSLQIYNGQAWEGVDGRIWTGSRWIPASSYNIVTLQDMYDIVDATQDYEYIYSESGFWAWWQKSWNAFTEKLFTVLGSGGTGSGTPGTDNNLDLDAEDPDADPLQEDSKTLWQFIVLVIAGGKSVVSGVRHMFSGVVSTAPDAVDDITGAFDPGGMAVGFLDGSSMDPDAADLGEATLSDSEEVDPWRYR